MENKVVDAVEIGAEVLEDIPKVHVEGKNVVVAIVVGTVLTAGVAYGIYRWRKAVREKKGIVDGEILGVEPPTEK